MEQPSKSRIPLRSDYGRGAYIRRIQLRAQGDSVRGELEDDFHHFAVTLWYEDARVSDVQGEEIRVPWTTCPESVALIARLRGLPLTRSLTAVARYTDPRRQCTHLFDIASLAVCHAARLAEGGAAERKYDISLPDRFEGRSHARLARDGEPMLGWLLQGLRILESEPKTFAGRELSDAAFNRWVATELDADLAEAALVLRRAVFIGLGRQYDFDRMRRAESFAQMVGAACHTFSADVIGRARRVTGSVRELANEGPRVTPNSRCNEKK